VGPTIQYTKHKFTPDTTPQHKEVPESRSIKDESQDRIHQNVRWGGRGEDPVQGNTLMREYDQALRGPEEAHKNRCLGAVAKYRFDPQRPIGKKLHALVLRDGKTSSAARRQNGWS